MNDMKASTSLTYWGRVTHICLGNLTIIGSDIGLSPGRRQAITWTNVGILLIWPIRTNFSGMLIEIHTFSFKKIHLKMSSGNGGHFVSASMCFNEFYIRDHWHFFIPINVFSKYTDLRSYFLLVAESTLELPGHSLHVYISCHELFVLWVSIISIV